MRRLLKFILLVPAAIYVLYVVAIPVFLNTAIFAKTLEMTDTAKTHLRVRGGWSLVPGTIRASLIRVLVREPGVDLDIDLHHPVLRFDFRGLFHKQAHLTFLHVPETSVAIRSKTAPEEAIEPIGSPAERELRIDLEERRKLVERWTITVDRVELPNLSGITLDRNRLSGRMAIFGSFLLQPGTRCEIYPSTFTVGQGKWNDEILDLNLHSRVQFHRFYKSHLTGSQVLHYVDAHVDGTAKANGLQFLNVTLRSLGDYGFGQGEANLRANLDIRTGKILPGSTFAADKSVIRISGPRFDVDGKGEIDWRAGPGENASILHAEISAAKTAVRLGKNRITGSVHRVIADAKILGLELASAFSGLSARLKVRGGKFESRPVGDPIPTEMNYDARIRIGGELTAVAGDYPDRAGLPKPSAFAVDIDDSTVRIPKVGKIAGNGRVALSVKTIDFRDGRADLPALIIDYRGKIEDKYPLVLNWTSKDASRIFGLRNSEDDHWHGSGELRVSEFDGVLDFLRATDRISGIVRAGLNATQIRTAIAWDVAPDDTRLEVREIDSNGIWSGFGTLVSQTPEDGGPAELSGQFKAKVLGLPLGVGLAGKSVQVKLFPGNGPVETTKQ